MAENNFKMTLLLLVTVLPFLVLNLQPAECASMFPLNPCTPPACVDICKQNVGKFISAGCRNSTWCLCLG
ncbi:hypothetical protein Lalb_Chr08g0237331 [Lupinus albus]|uniref:Knottin, scorpion toxin n=1 Tax=Lupinus albus TaxID=3870 RepID=A0A6A4Q413_LUPAL|nr:hypothetical protein Lalb_Chr08g0237331 [Lupinus albus]